MFEAGTPPNFEDASLAEAHHIADMLRRLQLLAADCNVHAELGMHLPLTGQLKAQLLSDLDRTGHPELAHKPEEDPAHPITGVRAI